MPEQHDDLRDRMIDCLLREEFGGEAPPDVSRAVMARAFPPRKRPWVWAIPTCAIAAAAVVVAMIFLMDRTGGPARPSAPGADTVLLDGEAVPRGRTVSTDQGVAELRMGGYARARLAPRGSVVIEGAPRKEAILLQQGQVTCEVDSNVGEFAVRTEAGTARAVGTKFSVRLAEQKAPDGKMVKQMTVQVQAGSVFLSGEWGESMVLSGETATTPLAVGQPKALTGVVTASWVDWIEVKADGADKAQRYSPRWAGGLPKDGGGFDKEMLSALAKAKTGQRVEVKWTQDERKRVIGLAVLPAASRPVQGEGTVVTGVVTGKSDNWVEVRADGAENPERYTARRPASAGGQPEAEVVAQIAKVKVGDKVEVKWTLQERKRVLSIRVVSEARQR